MSEQIIGHIGNEPKFKVGDKVRNKNIKDLPICTIESIEDTYYSCDYTTFDIKDQNQWELVKEQKSKHRKPFSIDYKLSGDRSLTFLNVIEKEE